MTALEIEAQNIVNEPEEGVLVNDDERYEEMLAQRKSRRAVCTNSFSTPPLVSPAQVAGLF